MTLLLILLKKCEKQFGCKVCSVVADNAANVSKKRQKLKTQDDVDVITYGFCGFKESRFSTNFWLILKQKFQKFMFHDNIVQTIKPCDWRKSHKDRAISC